MSRFRIAAALAAGVITLAAAWRLHRPDRTRTAAEPRARATPSPGTTTPAPERPLDHLSVAAHFDATARSRPERVALRTATRSVTYRELLAQARAARAALPPRGQSPQATLVPASLTPETVATILGLFAHGTTVVALDPELPTNRADNIAVILSRNGFHVVRAPAPPDVGALEPDDDSPLCIGSGVDDVTSIQFTSGSTGAPKAVLHTNGLWLADAQLLTDRFGLAKGRTVALCMPISFAGGLNVLIGSLVGGAEIVAVDPRDHSAKEAFDRIRASHAQVITCTPSFVDALHRAARGAMLPRVERIVTTGEPIQARHVKLARELAPYAVITNWVGST